MQQIPRVRQSDRDHFMQRVSVNERGCWMWIGALSKGGYGKFAFNGKCWRAHTAGYFIFRGVLVLGYGSALRHICDVRACVNPDHLIPGTQAQNVADMVTKGRSARGELQRNAKLTEAQVLEIRIADVHWSVWAKRYGITDDTVYDIRSGRSWKHLKGGK